MNIISKTKFLFVFFLLFGGCYLSISTACAANSTSTPQDLKDAINAKSAQLQQIDAERQQVLDNLNALNKQTATVQKDITKNNYQISQLNLSIQSSQISIEKNTLEIESLKNDIADIQAKSDAEKAAIINLLRELNEKEDQGLLTIFLKNQSLADSISETQNLTDLNSGLTTDVASLADLSNQQTQKLSQISATEKDQESQKVDLNNKKIIVQGQKLEQQALLAANKTQEKVYQQKITELEKMQAAVGAEIDKIESDLRKQIDPTILPTARPGVLGMPLKCDLKQNLTQGYGSTSFAQTSGMYVNNFHNGIDIATPKGTDVYAAESGRVLAIGNTDKYCPPVRYGNKIYGGSYGKYIVIKHDDNLSTLYTHLSLQVVKVGDIVNRGDLIGYTGMTGATTGPHLHFTVYANIYGADNKLLSPEIKMSNTCGPQPYGATLNPLDYL